MTGRMAVVNKWVRNQDFLVFIKGLEGTATMSIAHDFSPDRVLDSSWPKSSISFTQFVCCLLPVLSTFGLPSVAFHSQKSECYRPRAPLQNPKRLPQKGELSWAHHRKPQTM
jgi:hypothetical protein